MDLRTSYLGLTLAHPFVAGASPFGYRPGHDQATGGRRLRGGRAAFPVRRADHRGARTHREHWIASRPDSRRRCGDSRRLHDYPLGRDEYAEHVSRVKRAVRIPVIGSLNGTLAGIVAAVRADHRAGRRRRARTEPVRGGDRSRRSRDGRRAPLGRHRQGLEARAADSRLPSSSRRSSPPLATWRGSSMRPAPTGSCCSIASISPTSTSRRMDRRRARALDERRAAPAAALARDPARACPAVAGRHRRRRDADDGIKALLAGADVVQMVSALLRHGPTHLATMRQGLERWMTWHGMNRLDEIRGAVSLRATDDRSSFERARSIRTLPTAGSSLKKPRRRP